MISLQPYPPDNVISVGKLVVDTYAQNLDTQRILVLIGIRRTQI